MKLTTLFAAISLLAIVGCEDDTTPVQSTDATLNVIDSVTVANERQALEFRLALTGPVNRYVVFDYRVSGITADSGSDFTVGGGRDSILPFVTSKEIQVQTADDLALESDEEVSLTISNVTNAKLGVATTIGRILDNDFMSFSADIKPLLLKKGCGTGVCHGTLIKSAGIFIGDSSYYASRTGDTMYDSLMNQSGTHGTLIVAGQPDSSTLYQSLQPSPVYGGNQMKSVSGTALSAEEIDRVRKWIEQGAANN